MMATLSVGMGVLDCVSRNKVISAQEECLLPLMYATLPVEMDTWWAQKSVILEGVSCFM